MVSLGTSIAFLLRYAALMVGHSADRSNRKVKIFGVASKDKWTMLRSSPYGYNYMVDYHDED